MRRNREKIVCLRGHPFAGDNLYIDSNNKRRTEDVPEDDSVCFYCGYPDCRCDDEDEVCKHGVPFDEDCEECDEQDYEDHMGRFGPLPP